MAAKNSDPRHRLIFGISYTITVVWVISFGVGVVNQSYHPPATVHVLMLSVAAFVYGEGIRRSRDDD